ncbi:MAG TPA: nitrite/sulfite reductase [Polyangiales bacterium]|nr:nitrite/sulfite reductase [Polyangiales bacterium]
MPNGSWKELLGAKVRADWAAEIDDFELQIRLRKAGKIDEKVFAETRLRRGAYGQRYDNGQRHDGEEARALRYPCAELTKGPNTVWDAPGMQRIKIPYGKMSAEQLDVLCEVAEEYSDDILHITTRQDVQLHFVHIDDTPDLMRRLAAVGITTREACGNTVRNVTACSIAGVCRDETFDVVPYAHATAFFLLGHPDTQDFGRKFKVAFSGCAGHACGITGIHDIGCIARTRTVGGTVERGFEVYVGGGLGPVPQQAQLFSEFVPERELLPLCQAISRVFAAHGERANRARARLKFVLKKAGIAQFKEWVAQERAALSPDPRWTAFLDDLHTQMPSGLRPAGKALPPARNEAMALWLKRNIYLQRQAGYAAVTIRLPLGDLTTAQGRFLADVARELSGGELVTTVDQNLVLQWVSLDDIDALYERLVSEQLAMPGAGSIADVTSCPGTDTCKLGISSSRGLAAKLQSELAAAAAAGDAVSDLHVKCSGCSNSCGQHHIADIGFLGVSRNVKGNRMPHFQLLLGGQWENNGGSFGLAIGAIPSKLAPTAVKRLTDGFRAERQDGESFQAWSQRVGKKSLRDRVQDLIDAGMNSGEPSLFQDWGDPRTYSIHDLGVGECAGEVISPLEFSLAASEQKIFEAQLALEAKQMDDASTKARAAMIEAARGMIKHTAPLIRTDDDASVITAFRKHVQESERFAALASRFAFQLLRPADAELGPSDQNAVHQRIGEAQAFLEAAYEVQAQGAPRS